jgi:hypothetical protein
VLKSNLSKDAEKELQDALHGADAGTTPAQGAPATQS